MIVKAISKFIVCVGASVLIVVATAAALVGAAIVLPAAALALVVYLLYGVAASVSKVIRSTAARFRCERDERRYLSILRDYAQRNGRREAYELHRRIERSVDEQMRAVAASRHAEARQSKTKSAQPSQGLHD